MDKVTITFARFAIFVIYFWFGILKVIGESPASPLVKSLMEKTLPFLTFEQFIILFGIFEILIAITFLVPRFESFATFLLLAHIIMTALPLLLLPEITWGKTLVPTLEGQYIIKNIAIMGLAISIVTHARSYKI